MLKIALKGVLAHKLRLAMTAVAIVLGVAFVSGTYVFTDSIKSSFDDILGDAYSGIDLNVVGISEFGFTLPAFDEGIDEQIAAVPGVDYIVPAVDGTAQLLAPPPCQEGPDADPTRPCPIGGNGPPTLAFSYLPEGEGLVPFVVDQGDWPRAADEIVIDSFAATENALSVGQVIDVVTPAGIEPFTISGIGTFGDATNLLGATLTVFEFETAQRVFDLEGEVTSIAVILESGADISTVQAQISTFLPAGVEVVTGEDAAAADLAEVEEGLGFLNTILLVLAGVAVFVGAFLIQNTFRIIVAQRTKELALLRAVGATARQVTWMVVIEALVIGFVASVIGIGAGIVIAFLLKSAFGAFGFGLPSTALVVLPRTIVVGLIVGIVVTLFAAVVPARKAAAVPPVAALRDVATPPRSLGRRIAVGAGVTGLGIVMLLVGLFGGGDSALQLVGFGAVVTFIGVSLVAPLIARGFARFVGAPIARTGVVGRLAQENAMRRPRRTASTASALMIGVALVSVIAVFSASAKAGVASVFEDQFATDFQVRYDGFADPSTSGLPGSLYEELRELPELDVVVRDRFGLFRWDEESTETFLLGAEGPIGEVVQVEVLAGDGTDVPPGGAFLAETDAERLELGVGDTLRIQLATLEYAELEVMAIFDAATLGVPVIIDMETYDEVFDFQLDRFIYITIADGIAPEEARTAISAVTDAYPTAALTNTEELIGEIEGQIDGLLNLLTVLLGFAIVIALLGIVNTLALSISERRHEIGLLRAVGMTRRQVKRSIRWEAVLIAVFGGVLGLVVGLVLGTAVVIAIGEGLKLAIPTGQLIIYLVAAAIGGVVAAILPARRGAKTNILDAISYE
jgi:putative ABC transport system permease protein